MARINPDSLTLEDAIVHINRVAKVVKGGRRFSFSAIVVTGDRKGHVGFGLGKANEVPEAIRKAASAARKTIIKIPLNEGGTIPCEAYGEYGASRVFLKPAGPGTGVIAGGGVRVVLEASGVENILTKCIGSHNNHNAIRAAFDGLEKLGYMSDIQKRRETQGEKDVA